MAGLIDNQFSSNSSTELNLDDLPEIDPVDNITTSPLEVEEANEMIVADVVKKQSKKVLKQKKQNYKDLRKIKEMSKPIDPDQNTMILKKKKKGKKSKKLHDKTMRAPSKSKSGRVIKSNQKQEFIYCKKV